MNDNPADARPASDDMILLPRSVVERLVDPTDPSYAGSIDGDPSEVGCNYCGVWMGYYGHVRRDGVEHAPDCPVRIIRALLAQSST